MRDRIIASLHSYRPLITSNPARRGSCSPSQILAFTYDSSPEGSDLPRYLKWLSVFFVNATKNPRALIRCADPSDFQNPWGDNVRSGPTCAARSAFQRVRCSPHCGRVTRVRAHRVRAIFEPSPGRAKLIHTRSLPLRCHVVLHPAPP